MYATGQVPANRRVLLETERAYGAADTSQTPAVASIGPEASRANNRRSSMRIPNSVCPYCGYYMDAATGIQNSKITPNPDNFSICLSCGGLMRFDATLKLRVCTEADKLELELPQAAMIHRAQALIRERGLL